MGIDVGEKMHYVVGQRVDNNRFKILLVGVATDFGQLHDIAERMKVKMCVIDKGPDIHGVKEFQKQERFPVYRCQYSEFLMTGANFDRETGIVKVNRNEICDRVHDAFTTDKISIPRECTEIKEFAEQMTKLAKDTQKHPETGLPKTKWIKLGNKDDHWYHSSCYFILAATQTSPIRDGVPNKPIKFKNNYIMSS
jgi:hypothetical protein